jgi:non-catalytic primase subunit PriX-like protein
MSRQGPSLSDLELKYPFAPKSRTFFGSIPIEESLTSGEVLSQAEMRLFSALGRVRYVPHISELVEFSSFFAAALVASQDGFLMAKFSKKEAEKSKEAFVKERSNKTAIVRECFGASIMNEQEGDHGLLYSMPFEIYLALTVRYELNRSPKWKLTNQTLASGSVFFSDNLLNDFFEECARGAISEGVRNLKKGVFPKQLLELRERTMKYVPLQRQRTGKGYTYVEDLLDHPVSDGRHRLVWLVLAPYLINIKKLDDSEAIERIRGFVSVAGETADMKRFIEYNVRRARRNGLLPPTFSTLKMEHPDLYSLLPKEALASESKPKGEGARSNRPLSHS